MNNLIVADYDVGIISSLASDAQLQSRPIDDGRYAFSIPDMLQQKLAIRPHLLFVPDLRARARQFPALVVQVLADTNARFYAEREMHDFRTCLVEGGFAPRLSVGDEPVYVHPAQTSSELEHGIREFSSAVRSAVYWRRA